MIQFSNYYPWGREWRKMYRVKSKIGFAECGEGGTLRLEEAVSRMVDCCQFQENEDARLKDFLAKRDLVMFLCSMQVDIMRMPAYNEEVTLDVKIYDVKSMFGFRRLVMRDAEGGVCFLVNATGAFYSPKDNRAVKIDPAELEEVFEAAEEMETLPRKIPVPPGEGEDGGVYTVVKSDIDPNGHVMSARYFSLAEDCLAPGSVYGRLRIEFKQQARLGERLQLVHHKTGEADIIEIKGGNGKTAAVVEFSRPKG